MTPTPPPTLSIALYRPDIPQNAGTILRMAACFEMTVHIIEPCGFLLDDRKLRRAGMDYLDQVQLTRHLSWQHFIDAGPWEADGGRLVLATRFGATALDGFFFRPGDCIMMGRESAGVPQEVHDYCGERVFIPMREDLRSLNVAQSAAIIAFEASRQLRAQLRIDFKI